MYDPIKVKKLGDYPHIGPFSTSIPKGNHAMLVLKFGKMASVRRVPGDQANTGNKVGGEVTNVTAVLHRYKIIFRPSVEQFFTKF